MLSLSKRPAGFRASKGESGTAGGLDVLFSPPTSIRKAPTFLRLAVSAQSDLTCHHAEDAADLCGRCLRRFGIVVSLAASAGSGLRHAPRRARNPDLQRQARLSRGQRLVVDRRAKPGFLRPPRPRRIYARQAASRRQSAFAYSGVL